MESLFSLVFGVGQVQERKGQDHLTRMPHSFGGERALGQVTSGDGSAGPL